MTEPSDNPQHESLVARFDHLDRVLKDAITMSHIASLVEQYIGAAIKIVNLIREQVVK